jgi:hypothetical protein
MREVIGYEGEFGLMAILQALDNLRRMLAMDDVEPQQAAGYLGCINLHLAEITGVRGEFLEQLQECSGLLCPNCKGYVGFISNLSSHCHLCGAKLFPSVADRSDHVHGPEGS